MGYKRLSSLQLVFIAMVGALTLAYGIYHLTHQGTRSGTFELISFALLVLSLFLPNKPNLNYHQLSPLQVILIGIVAGVAGYFGVYHLTTPDELLSGILELISFTLLALAILLPFKPRANSKRS